jgi:hypothetical protein
MPLMAIAARLPAMPSETETLALHLVRALCDATAGQPQRESLGNLGADKADAAAIAYADT